MNVLVIAIGVVAGVIVGAFILWLGGTRPILSWTLTGICAVLLIMSLAGCDNGGGSYTTHKDAEEQQDDEQQAEHCRKYPRDCR